MNSSRTQPRLLTPELTAALATMPVVVVTGARQTGKSTLVQRLVSDQRLYLTLDDLDVLGDATEAPAVLLERAARVTVDEVQRAPALLHEIKRAVDRGRAAGRFLLTGSANLALMHRVSESLAGRATYLTLWPLTRRERLGLGAAGRWDELFETPVGQWRELLLDVPVKREDWRALVRTGGYPTPALELATADARARWFAGYEATYLERDVLQLAAVQSIPEFRRLMRAIALRLGGLMNQAEFGRDVGLPQPTVHRYLGLLEASYQVVRVPGFAANRGKRLIKAPKLYWSDTGLAVHLAAADELGGAHLENLILADLLAWAGAKTERPEVMYWRTAAGAEVDFVVEWRGKLLAVEVKASARVSSADARALGAFRAEHPRACRGGLVLYTGTEVQRVAEGVVAAPWCSVI